MEVSDNQEDHMDHKLELVVHMDQMMVEVDHMDQIKVVLLVQQRHVQLGGVLLQ